MPDLPPDVPLSKFMQKYMFSHQVSFVLLHQRAKS